VKAPKKSSSPGSVAGLETEKIESEDDEDVGNVSQDVSDLLLLASISKPSALPVESAKGSEHKAHLTQALEGQLQSMKAELDECKRSVQSLNEDLKQQKAEAACHQATYDQDLARMKRENVMLRQDLTLLKNTNKVLTDSLVQTQSLQKMASPREDLLSPEDAQKRVEEGVKSETMALQSVFDAAEEEYLYRIKELKTSFTALETRNGAMKSKMKELLQDLDKLRIQDSKNTDWKNKFFTEVGKSETLAKELLQLKELAKKLDQDKAQLESTLSSFSHRTMELEAQGNKELRETKALLESTVQDMERVKTEKASVEALLRESEASLLDLSSEKDILKTSMEHLLKRISALEEEKVSQSTSDNELKKTNLQLTHKISLMEESLEDMHLGNKQELCIWKRRVDELKENLGTAKAELQSMKQSQAQVKTLESELAHKQVEFVKMQETVNWLTEKNSELESELSNLFDGQQSESQSDTLETTPRNGTIGRTVTKCRYLNSKLLQADLLATEASSKVERLLEATANSAGASSSATLTDLDFSPSDLEENISASFIALTCSNSRAEKIIAQDKLSALLKKLYLAHLSQPPSPSGQSSPIMGTRAAPDLLAH
jgi:chromosome segregation ATPase